MNPLEYIQQYTSNILKSAVWLKHLGYDSYPLPSIEEALQIKHELLSIHPADVTAKLVWEDYKSKERFIKDSLNKFLDIDGCGYAVKIDDGVYDYWDGLTKKLVKHTEGMDEETAKKYIDRYSSIIWEISCALHDTTEGMRGDLNYMFNDEGMTADSTEDCTEGLRLTGGMDVPEAHKYFQRCIKQGWMSLTPNGAIWHQDGIRLAYICNRIYKERGYQRPQKELMIFFNDINLKANLTTVEYEPKNLSAKKWRAEIDELIFFD